MKTATNNFKSLQIFYISYKKIIIPHNNNTATNLYFTSLNWDITSRKEPKTFVEWKLKAQLIAEE